jgi:hypothetical protein
LYSLCHSDDIQDVLLCLLQALATVALDGSIALQTQPTPQEVARVLKTEPRDNTTAQAWLNALLGTYAGLQLLNSFVAFNLLQESYGACMHHALFALCAAGRLDKFKSCCLWHLLLKQSAGWLACSMSIGKLACSMSAAVLLEPDIKHLKPLLAKPSHLILAGGFETRLGLVILSSLSFNLFYENALLVAGRYIGKDSSGMELLQELSKWRFLAHSGAPLALIAGLNMAGRAGVQWAANPYWEGLIGLLILAVVAVSSVRNSFFLEITPVWNRGVLRYSYAPGAADFTKIIPVIVTTLLLVILGWQSYQQDPALLPFFVGPLAAFILNALPASKDGETGNKLPPQFVLGNGGEVALFAGLVATEVLLHMQGK